MRIGIFGGSFDPVHKEHTNFVRTAVENLRLDKVFVMPAHIPPHKLGKTLSSNVDRLQMCKIAFLDIEQAEVSDYEMTQDRPSYTYLTCAHFKNKYPEAELFFLVGTDMLRDFPTWKEPEKILENATLAVCGRCEEDGWWEAEQKEFIEKFGKPFIRVDYNGAKVSSTQIRVLAGAGMRLTDFLDEKTAEYIEKKGLYQIKNADKALALEKPQRQAHSLRVAYLAAKRALSLGIPERKAIQAALFHDCGKNISSNHPFLQGFSLPNEHEVPASVWHQYVGAYLAENIFGVQDEEVLNAIRYHTSGRPDMGELEKLIFLADMLEEERKYEGVEELRFLFWKDKNSLDECLEEALYQTLEFLKQKKADIYPLTQKAYEFYKK